MENQWKNNALPEQTKRSRRKMSYSTAYPPCTAAALSPGKGACHAGFATAILICGKPMEKQRITGANEASAMPKAILNSLRAVYGSRPFPGAMSIPRGFRPWLAPATKRRTYFFYDSLKGTVAPLAAAPPFVRLPSVDWHGKPLRAKGREKTATAAARRSPSGMLTRHAFLHTEKGLLGGVGRRFPH